MIYNMDERLKELRENRQLSQEEVGKILGVTRATISGYECGNAQPPADIIVKLASLYRCTSDYILGLDSQKSITIDSLPPKKQKLFSQLVNTALELTKE